MLSFLTPKVLIADRADNMLWALNLVDEECLIVFEILVADGAIVMLRGGPLVTFELSFRLKVSVTVRKGARDELSLVFGGHVVGVEALCNGMDGRLKCR